MPDQSEPAQMGHPPFTQLATGARSSSGGGMVSLIYGLTAEGEIYQYVFGKGWLTMEQINADYRRSSAERGTERGGRGTRDPNW